MAGIPKKAQAFIAPLPNPQPAVTERRPARVPVFIQPHGMLLAARESDLQIVYVSANSEEFLGAPPETILGRPFWEILGAASANSIRNAARAAGRQLSSRLITGIPGNDRISLYAMVHSVDKMLCVELEPSITGQPWNPLASRVEAVLDGLQNAETPLDLCALAAAKIRRLTGYNRVMVCRFHPDGHGEVIGEDHRPGERSLLHLSLPASVFPPELRASCLQTRTRMIANIDAPPVPILSHPSCLEDQPFDASHCCLRAASGYGIRMIREMDAAAGFAISLVQHQALWGMVLCYHPTDRVIMPEARASCDLLGRILSAMIGIATQNEKTDGSTLRRARREELLLSGSLVSGSPVADQLSENFDALTKLANRQMLLGRLTRLQNDPPGRPASLIFINIDRFKLVNDTMGHEAGDSLLVQVGRRLTEIAGDPHLVARLGGDEFVVCCEDSNLQQAQAVAQAIIQSFQLPFHLEERPFRCSISIGVAPACGQEFSAIAEILHAADSAMYAAKRMGGNQVALFENPRQKHLLRQVQLEQDIFHAIERGEMQVHFQAQIAVEGPRLVGFEALLRWTHPAYGNISPAEFIPMAEQTDHIQAIGTWVLRESLSHIRRWRERYVADLFVAVNVSVKQLATRDFADEILRALEETGTPCDALRLEVTESLLMQPTAELQLNSIQAMGVRVAVDDFGTGYSSLSYLQRLAVSELKLDHTFLSDVGRDERKTALFHAIVTLAHTMGLSVVAEGVENMTQLACLRQSQCDRAQGYLLSRPIPVETIEALFLGEWSPSEFPTVSL